MGGSSGEPSSSHSPGRNSPMASSPSSPFSMGCDSPREFSQRTVLVLDLDETLVHIVTARQRHDFKATLQHEGSPMVVHVAKRPGCDEFIRRVAQHFELMVFTAGTEEYCRQVVAQIDPQGHISTCLSRQSCTPRQDGGYTKDLIKIGRRLDDVILLDNDPRCFSLQPENALPIKSWYGDDTKDTELEKAVRVLEMVVDARSGPHGTTAVHTLHALDAQLRWERVRNSTPPGTPEQRRAGSPSSVIQSPGFILTAH